jgi:hypothetical protein
MRLLAGLFVLWWLMIAVFSITESRPIKWHQCRLLTCKRFFCPHFYSLWWYSILPFGCWYLILLLLLTVRRGSWALEKKIAARYCLPGDSQLSHGWVIWWGEKAYQVTALVVPRRSFIYNRMVQQMLGDCRTRAIGHWCMREIGATGTCKSTKTEGLNRIFRSLETSVRIVEIYYGLCLLWSNRNLSEQIKKIYIL